MTWGEAFWTCGQPLCQNFTANHSPQEGGEIFRSGPNFIQGFIPGLFRVIPGYSGFLFRLFRYQFLPELNGELSQEFCKTCPINQNRQKMLNLNVSRVAEHFKHTLDHFLN